MQPDPLISLVLPVKNGLPHIQTTIAALHRQTYRNFELVVQDGGSTDGTLAYLNSITGLPRVEIVSQPDTGIGQAYNRGIVRSRGELLCLIASDEYPGRRCAPKGSRVVRTPPQRGRHLWRSAPDGRQWSHLAGVCSAAV